MTTRLVAATFVTLLLAGGSIDALAAAGTAETFHPIQSPLPVAPPSNAIVLLDDKGTNLFVSMRGGKIDWPVEHGALVSTPGPARTNHLVSRLHFRDADIHVELMVAEQGRGNSGIYLHGNYEMQIFDSFGQKRLSQEDMGALYGFAKPLVNASRKVGEWQVYDIRYHAPRRDEHGKVVTEGSITAWLNGQMVQHQTKFGEPRSHYHPYRHGTTPYLQTIWKRQKRTMTGPLFVQDHGSPTRFRNVWVRPLDDHAFLYDPADNPDGKRSRGIPRMTEQDRG